MDIGRMPLNRGWGLYGRGWKTFTREPLTWVLAMLVFLVLSLVLNLIPLLGALVLSIISPALAAGFLKMAHDTERGEKIGVGHLFLPLQDPDRRTPLLLLGLLALGAAVVVMVIMGLMVGGAMMGAAPNEAPAGPVAALGLFGMLLMFVLYLAIFAALAFAIPLVYFRGLPLGDAVMNSIRGFLANIGPLIIFSLLYFVLAIVAMLPMGLGFLILGPVVFGALYGAYEEIFPEGVEVLEARPR